MIINKNSIPRQSLSPSSSRSLSNITPDPPMPPFPKMMDNYIYMDRYERRPREEKQEISQFLQEDRKKNDRFGKSPLFFIPENKEFMEFDDLYLAMNSMILWINIIKHNKNEIVKDYVNTQDKDIIKGIFSITLEIFNFLDKIFDKYKGSPTIVQFLVKNKFVEQYNLIVDIINQNVLMDDIINNIRDYFEKIEYDEVHIKTKSSVINELLVTYDEYRQRLPTKNLIILTHTDELKSKLRPNHHHLKISQNK